LTIDSGTCRECEKATCNTCWIRVPYGKEQMSEIIEAVGNVIEGGLGFRYLFSRTYRERTRKRWKGQSRISIAYEVLEATIGVAFMTIILFALIRMA